MENQKIKKSAGRLSPTPMGDYDDTTTYRRLDWVYYGGTTYICKKNNTLGIKPSDPERWQKIIDEIGDMEIIFTEAEQLENITNEDKLSIIFGKIKKWFTHFNDIICRDNNDTKVTRIRADEGVQVSNRANDRHIPVYASDFVAGTGGTTGRSLANLSLKDLSDNNYIDVLTNINQITSIGFWKIGSIDSSYAQSIGIRAVDNVGDFYALVSNYNGDGSRFNYGNLQLFSPRLGVNHFEIRVWNGAAAARHAVTYDTMLNTTEQISANTESFYAAGALAVKAMMADYNNKINQINSNLANKLKIVTILGINTYSTNVEYTPTNKANIFTYYIPILVWRQGAVVAKQGYDNTYDIVTADIPSVDSSICVIRHATFLINKTTGAIKIEKLNQANLQSDGNYIFSTDTMEIGLLGISL